MPLRIGLYDRRMGKLIYLLNTSVDGFIETPERSLDWATVDQELHSWFNDQTRGLQASLYGRRMYEVMSGHWPTAEAQPDVNDVERDFARVWNAMLKIVFSNTLESVDHNSRLVRGDVREVWREVRREFDGDIDVSGANLAGQFVRAGLVDEYQVMVHPVALGSGTRFWPELDSPIPLRLTETRTFASGVTLLSYARA